MDRLSEEQICSYNTEGGPATPIWRSRSEKKKKKKKNNAGEEEEEEEEQYKEGGLIGEEKQKQVPTTLKKILGLEEVLNVNIWRTSLAELLGTAILLFALDAIVIYSIQAETKTPNLVMSTLVAITAPAAIYILAQCLGGILGALALKAVVKSSIEDTFSLGGCTLTIVMAGPQGPMEIGLETGQSLWLEIICSFVFLLASIWMAFD
ncbi:hypothetical protein Q3G72_023260 [Acer saccharum]|nr:hypothetical protein Q3G72_023260 [Acer saccharum]